MVISEEYEEMIRANERERYRRILMDRKIRSCARKRNAILGILQRLGGAFIIAIAYFITFSSALYDVSSGNYDGTLLIIMIPIGLVLLFGRNYMKRGL